MQPPTLKCGHPGCLNTFVPRNVPELELDRAKKNFQVEAITWTRAAPLGWVYRRYNSNPNIPLKGRFTFCPLHAPMYPSTNELSYEMNG